MHLKNIISNVTIYLVIFYLWYQYVSYFQIYDLIMDLDSTQALLDSTIPTPTVVDSVVQDEDEEEIFFGQITDKEKRWGSKSKRYVITVHAWCMSCLNIKQTCRFLKLLVFNTIRINSSENKQQPGAARSDPSLDPYSIIEDSTQFYTPHKGGFWTILSTHFYSAPTYSSLLRSIVNLGILYCIAAILLLHFWGAAPPWLL